MNIEPLNARSSQLTPVSGCAITTIIPAYGSAATIERAVNSALSQNAGDILVTVVVDGPCAETQRILDALNDARISVTVNETNLGAPASRNCGLAEVQSPYVSFLDADDYFEGDLLGPLVKRMESEGAEIGFGPSVHLNPGGQRRHGPHYRDHADVFARWLCGVQNVNTASVAWSTRYLRSIGGWDEAITRNQDGEVALRAILLGARYACSFEGAGVWVNNEPRPRITARTDNLGALVDVVAKLEAIRSDVVPDEVRLGACACQLRRIAVRAYREGNLDVAAHAMERRRNLGFPDPRFDTEKFFANLLGPLSLRQRAAAYRGASRLKNAVSGRRLMAR